jgi:hypothetical protein
MTAPITDAALAEIERLAAETNRGEGPASAWRARAARYREVTNPDNLLALIARLRAAERAREAEGWQDISTAPKNKPLWLTGFGWGDEKHGRWVTIGSYRRYLHREGWHDFDHVPTSLYTPTHWMPLDAAAPPAPRAEVG